MSTRREKDRLKAMSRDRSFRVERKGDGQYGVSDNHRASRLSLRGELTAACQYLAGKGVLIQPDRLIKTVN